MSVLKIYAENRQARHLYTIEDTLEAGLVLVGAEVKAIRMGKAQLNQAYVIEDQEEMWLLNSHIGLSSMAWMKHDPIRPKKLLLKKKEIHRWMGKVRLKGMTIVPLKIYQNDQGWLKISIALAQGKQEHDKRASIKAREWQREQAKWIRQSR